MTRFFIVSFVLSFSVCFAADHKFKVGDCLYFPDDAAAKSNADGATWKIVGISKDGKYLVRTYGGPLGTNEWHKNIGELTKENTDKDGVKVLCPNE